MLILIKIVDVIISDTVHKNGPQGVVVHTLNPQQRGKGDKVSQGFSEGEWGKRTHFPAYPYPLHNPEADPKLILPTCLPNHFTHHTLYGARKELHSVFIDSKASPPRGILYRNL